MAVASDRKEPLIARGDEREAGVSSRSSKVIVSIRVRQRPNGGPPFAGNPSVICRTAPERRSGHRGFTDGGSADLPACLISQLVDRTNRRETAMRRTVLSTLTLTFVIATAALTSPAVATQTSQALSICVSRGTACTVSNKGGGHEICVNNTGGKQCVKCPALTAKDQTCTTARTRNASGVVDVLRGVAKTPLRAKQ